MMTVSAISKNIYLYSVHEAMPIVVEQLSELWSQQMIKLLFDPLFSYMSALASSHLDTNISVSAVSPSPTKSTSLVVIVSCYLSCVDFGVVELI